MYATTSAPKLKLTRTPRTPVLTQAYLRKYRVSLSADMETGMQSHPLVRAWSRPPTAPTSTSMP